MRYRSEKRVGLDLRDRIDKKDRRNRRNRRDWRNRRDRRDRSGRRNRREIPDKKFYYSSKIHNPLFNKYTTICGNIFFMTHFIYR